MKNTQVCKSKCGLIYKRQYLLVIKVDRKIRESISNIFKYYKLPFAEFSQYYQSYLLKIFYNKYNTIKVLKISHD